MIRRRRPKRSEPERVGSLVGRVLGDLGMGPSARVLRLAECWEEAVGADVARHCQPTAIQGEVLEATVDSSVWCQQLQLQRQEILAALRRVAGDDAPADLRLRVGGESTPGSATGPGDDGPTGRKGGRRDGRRGDRAPGTRGGGGVRSRP